MMQDLHEETVVHANSATQKTAAFSNRFPTISALNSYCRAVRGGSLAAKNKSLWWKGHGVQKETLALRP